MKKKTTLAVMLALSGAAYAQSSVTLYGVVDVAIAKINTGAPTANDASGKVQMASSSSMNNAGSYIGFRGIEDLGGGLKTGFMFETGIDLNEGNSFGAGAGFWGRTSKLWVEGTWGTLQFGRSFNPSFLGIASWELTTAAVYSIVGGTYNYAAGGARTSSLIVYKTPNMNGFSGELGYTLKANNVINNEERGKWDMHAKYKGGPIIASFVANQVKGAKTSYALGGRYTFGSFAVATSYQNAAKEQSLRSGATLGVKYAAGLVSVVVDVARDFKNEWGAKKYTNLLVEGKYAISKRSFLYAAYRRLDGDNNYSLGLRHNF